MFLNELVLICLYRIKWFQVLFAQIIIAIVSTQLNVFKYCYLTLIILFNINYLFVYCEVLTSIAI